MGRHIRGNGLWKGQHACVWGTGSHTVLQKTVEGMGFQEIAQQPLGELHSQPPLAGQLFFQKQWETLKGVSEDLFQKDHGVIY